jgi:hypothetical protein
MAQADVIRGALDDEWRLRIKETVDEVIEDLADHEDISPPSESAEEEKERRPVPAPALRPDDLAPAWGRQPVLCVAGRGVLDESAAALLVQVLEKHGIGARLLPTQAVSASNLPHLDAGGVQMICLSYLDPGSSTHARYLARRLRRKVPSAKILVGFWTLVDDESGRVRALSTTGADRIVTSFRETVEHIVSAAQREAVERAASPEASVPAVRVG